MNRLLSTAIVLYTVLPVMAASSEHGGSGDGPNPFAGTIYQSIAAAVVFLALLFILKSKAWGPILKGLQDRENKIKGDLEHAEQSAKAATAKLAEYEAKLAAAQAEALKIIDQGRLDAQRVAAQVRDQAQAEITAAKTRAESDIRAAKEQALSEIYTTTATLATDVAGKILRRQINPQDQQQLVQESLAELSKTGARN